ncbi:MAG: hypothetical protein LBD59_02050 [Prevotellaceae bacterium]|jgi:hypothetical protein|nr:hypothetical protein [Prevotellaceae bacterium]
MRYFNYMTGKSTLTNCQNRAKGFLCDFFSHLFALLIFVFKGKRENISELRAFYAHDNYALLYILLHPKFPRYNRINKISCVLFATANLKTLLQFLDFMAKGAVGYTTEYVQLKLPKGFSISNRLVKNPPSMTEKHGHGTS